VTNFSILDQIYSQFAAISVSYTNKAGASASPTVYYGTTLPDSIETAHLPARLLVPPSGSVEVMEGGNIRADWRITDLFLLEAAAQGSGIRDEAGVMVSYMMAYSNALGRVWEINYQSSVRTHTVSAALATGKFEYPPASGVWFWGVRAELTIQESIF